MPFDKNTSRNQITHRLLLINVEKPQSEIYHRQEEEKENEGERAKERERWYAIHFFSIEKSAFREDLQRTRIAFYVRGKADNIEIFSK